MGLVIGLFTGSCSDFDHPGRCLNIPSGKIRNAKHDMRNKIQE
jgi:hypothetical protein